MKRKQILIVVVLFIDKAFLTTPRLFLVCFENVSSLVIMKTKHEILT